MESLSHPHGRGLIGKELQLEFDPQYFIRDYLGNTRMVFHANSSTGFVESIQEDHFDPFGMKFGMGNNPVRLIDPDGLATVWSLETSTMYRPIIFDANGGHLGPVSKLFFHLPTKNPYESDDNMSAKRAANSHHKFHRGNAQLNRNGSSFLSIQAPR